MTDSPLLAIDTSVEPASVAIGSSGRVTTAQLLRSHERHADSLFESIGAVLDRRGLAVADLSGLVVGGGPGSFTGVRIAAATVKGLAHGSGLPVWAFSSLAAHAAVVPMDARPLHVLFDARGDRMFWAGFRMHRDARAPSMHEAPTFITLPELLQKIAGKPSLLAGIGAEKHRAALERCGHEVLSGAGAIVRASGLIALQHAEGSKPLADVAGWEPEYLRAPSAVRERAESG